ncbi:MAG: N-acetyltransferase [Proteobacteria bacterium]|nr:N-acetyltransferase [Desulfobacula sp.]MBU3954103.1 N-acetyltransferase [Pseudomonadota bacterium]MBU4129850.1 N-acetyltransferase [Pseudomonadota bacterium]
MKIRKPDLEIRPKVLALLVSAFPKSRYEAGLVEQFHVNETPIHEWACIHINRVIAYIAFSNAYNGSKICGLHLAPLAVAPQFQRQGVGSELMKFALRQESIKNSPVFVLGDPKFYRRFGFESCTIPICPFDKNNKHFLAIGNPPTSRFIVGYEPEFGPR